MGSLIKQFSVREEITTATDVREQTAGFIPAFALRKRGLTPPQFMSMYGPATSKPERRRQ